MWCSINRKIEKVYTNKTKQHELTWCSFQLNHGHKRTVVEVDHDMLICTAWLLGLAAQLLYSVTALLDGSVARWLDGSVAPWLKEFRWLR